LPNANTGEAATNNNNSASLSRSGACNGCYLNPTMSIHSRASLVPAAAVIPARIAYTNAVAVKKLVVGFRVRGCKVALLVDLVGWFCHSSRVFRVVDSTLCISTSALHTRDRFSCGSLLYWWWKRLRV